MPCPPNGAVHHEGTRSRDGVEKGRSSGPFLVRRGRGEYPGESPPEPRRPPLFNLDTTRRPLRHPRGPVQSSPRPAVRDAPGAHGPTSRAAVARHPSAAVPGETVTSSAVAASCWWSCKCRHAASLKTAANSSGRDQRDTVDSGSTRRKSSSTQTSAVSSNSDTKVSASGPATR